MASNKPEELRERTKRFAIAVVILLRKLPFTPETKVVRYQLVKACTSVAANYRAVCRARSKAEFIAKIGVVLEDADESAFWLEFIIETELLPVLEVTPHLNEANELVAIFSSSQRTARGER